MPNLSIRVAVLLTTTLAASCGHTAHPDKAYAVIENSQGKRIGTVVVRHEQNGVQLRLDVEGLSKGTYGYGIHDFGECNVPNFVNAGNPFPRTDDTENASGALATAKPLGKIHVVEDGRAQQEVFSDAVTLREGKNSLFHPGGTSFVIYEPSTHDQILAASGRRVGCGVILPATRESDLPQKLPEGELKDANTGRDMDIPGEIHKQPQ